MKRASGIIRVVLACAAVQLFGQTTSEKRDQSRRPGAGDPRAASVVGDDLIMDLNVLMPLPRLRAKVTAIRIEGDRIIQTFGGKEAAPPHEDPKPPDGTAKNYMYYRGGTIRFPKFIMEDADIQVVDGDPGDPLDYSLEHYFEQIVAGQSRTTRAART